jgi:hypothetical protein
MSISPTIVTTIPVGAALAANGISALGAPHDGGENDFCRAESIASENLTFDHESNFIANFEALR